ncbi:hypothetical protein [Paenibacillus odorifer]|uniref:hypothetical protein n=1 Tax=Paenibacillus odorifer TaxID=189426 RepID=UPI00096FA892|nr:hypothetical protein [Paenibacillus odorifer]OMD67470.1 hypothetical protein BSK50_30300 [Paenibacillus odorifer]
MLNLGRYGSRNNLNLQLFDYISATPIMTFDYATTTSNEWSGETVFARGGDGNPKRIAWSGDKDSTLTVETQVFTLQHLAMLAGEPIEKGATNIFKSQVVTVKDGGTGSKTITLSKTPINGTASIKVFSYVNGVIAEPQEVQSVTGKDVVLASSATVEIGQDVEVYYQFTAASAAKLQYTTKGFPGYVRIVGDTLYADEKAASIVPVQQIYYKAKLQPNFTVTYSPTGDPSSLSMTFDLFPELVNGKEVMKEEVLYEDEL